MTYEFNVSTIEFWSEGEQCAADLYLPRSEETMARPAVVFATGFAGVKEISADAASFFARAGYVSLAIDYRTCGASGGTPRGQLFPVRQAEDVRNAVSYLETRKDVDPKRIAIWGTSFGGGVVIYAGATDRRIAAVMAQIPVVDGLGWHKMLRGAVEWEALLDAIDEDRRQRARGVQSRRIPVSTLANSGELCALPADKTVIDLLGEFQKHCPTWSPETTLESVEKILEYSPESMIERIAPRPLLITTVSGYDVTHPAQDVLRAYEKAKQPKEVIILPYDQLGLYGGEGLQKALALQIDFANRHLGPMR